MSDLNEANAARIQTAVIGLYLPPHEKFAGEIDALIEQLKLRPTDDLEFAYQTRDAVMRKLIENGYKPPIINLYAESRDGMVRLDLGLDENRMPNLREYKPT